MCEILDGMFNYIFNIAKCREDIIDFLVDVTHEINEMGYKEGMQML